MEIDVGHSPSIRIVRVSKLYIVKYVILGVIALESARYILEILPTRFNTIETK